MNFKHKLIRKIKVLEIWKKRWKLSVCKK